MTKFESIAFPVIATLSLTAYGMSQFMSNDAFGGHWIAREDGALEWLGACSLLAGAAVCWFRCWQLQKVATRTFLACTAAYGSILFFGMAEELSWGQRIFGVETPGFLADVNAQKETNLHNLVLGGVSVNKLIFGKLLGAGLGVFLIFTPIAYQRSFAIRNKLDRLAVPVPRTRHTVAILLTALLMETSSATKRGEITEFALSAFTLLLLLNPRNNRCFSEPSSITSTPCSPVQDSYRAAA